MEYLDLDALRRANREDDPFRYVIVPEFLTPARLQEVNADFPAIEQAGNFPIEKLTFGPGSRT